MRPEQDSRFAGGLRGAVIAAILLCGLPFSPWPAAAAAVGAGAGAGANRVTAGAFYVERPTLENLGFEWRVSGDANRNASVQVAYRRKGTSAWKAGLPLLRLNGEDTHSAGCAPPGGAPPGGAAPAGGPPGRSIFTRLLGYSAATARSGLSDRASSTFSRSRAVQPAARDLEALDDVGENPSYYFGHAAWSLYHHKPEEARNWLRSANTIYSVQKTVFYAASLFDMGYLPLPPPPPGADQ